MTSWLFYFGRNYIFRKPENFVLCFIKALFNGKNQPLSEERLWQEETCFRRNRAVLAIKRVSSEHCLWYLEKNLLPTYWQLSRRMEKRSAVTANSVRHRQQTYINMKSQRISCITPSHERSMWIPDCIVGTSGCFFVQAILTPPHSSTHQDQA